MEPQQPTRGTGRSYDAAGSRPPGFEAAGPADAGGGRSGTAGRAEGDARQFAEDARQQARSAADAVKQGASDAARQVSEQVRGGAQAVTQQAGQQAAEAARRIREHGVTMLGEQKQRAAGGLGDIGSAIRGAADRLHEAKDDNIAHYLDAAAESVERASQYLQGRDVNQLMHDAQSLARRRPEWFFGGAFIAGLALARFAKARRPRPQGGEYGADFNAGGSFGDAPAMLPSPAQAARPSEFDQVGPGAPGAGSAGFGSSSSSGSSASSGTSGSSGSYSAGGGSGTYGSLSSPGSGSSASGAAGGSNPFSVPTPEPRRYDGPDIMTNPPANLMPPAGGGGMNP